MAADFVFGRIPGGIYCGRSLQRAKLGIVGYVVWPDGRVETHFEELSVLLPVYSCFEGCVIAVSIENNFLGEGGGSADSTAPRQGTTKVRLLSYGHGSSDFLFTKTIKENLSLISRKGSNDQFLS